MKRLSLTFILVLTATLCAFSQNMSKPTMAVLNFESVGLENTAKQLGALIRLEVMKLDQYVVIEKHDMLEALATENIDIENCYSTSCMKKAGTAMKADNVISGTFEQFGSKLVINFKWFDINKDQLIKSLAYEYIYVPEDIEKIAKVSVQKLLGVEVDNQLEALYNYEIYEKREIMNSDLKLVNLSGPRFGLAYFSGYGEQFFKDPKSRGGLNAQNSVITQIGFQWEKAYLNSGNFQALLEVIPMFSGMDKGLFIPSFTFMNGFRLNNIGWEIGFGPSFRFTKEAKGYLDENNQWISTKDNRFDHNYQWSNPDDIFYRLDRRGTTYLRASWVVSVGKTFKSGTMNIPVNAFANFTQQGTVYGISMGYNISKRKKNKS